MSPVIAMPDQPQPNEVHEKPNSSGMSDFRIEPVPSEFAGVLLSGKNIAVANALQYLPIVSFIASVGLVGWIIFGPADESSTVTNRSHYVLGAIGFLILVASYFCMSKSSFLQHCWLWRIARTQIKNRPDKWIDPIDPRANFVAIVPRSSWTEPTFRNASDVGFLLVDNFRNTVLFEGDNERYEIPIQTIAQCKQEYSSAQTSTPLMGNLAHMYKERRYFFTVIQIFSSKQSCELAFRVLTGKGLFGQEAQGAANLSLVTEVHQLKRIA